MAFLESRGNLQSFEPNPSLVGPLLTDIWPF